MASTALADGSITALKEGLRRLRSNDRYSDFTISCGPHSFKVHRAVICAQSEYFDTLCRSTGFSETGSRSIKLKAIGDANEGDVSDGKESSADDDACDDPGAIERMVEFFYTLGYDPDKYPPDSMVMRARVFAAAVKYQVPALKNLAAFRFAAEVQRAAVASPATFAEAIRVVYSTTPGEVRELRKVVEDTLHKQTKLLARAEIGDAVKDISGLAYELFCKAYAVGAEASTSTSPNCRYCGRPGNGSRLY